MSKVTLDFDLSELQSYSETDTGYYEVETIEHAIVNAAARHLLSNYNAKIQALITAEIERILTSGIEDQVRERVEQMVADTFNSEYEIYNTYGKPTGETTTIAAQVEGMLERIINEKVDYNGKKLSDSSYGRKDTKTRWEWHVEEILTRVVDKELKNHIQSVVNEAQQQAKQRIADKLFSELK